MTNRRTQTMQPAALLPSLLLGLLLMQAGEA